MRLITDVRRYRFRSGHRSNNARRFAVTIAALLMATGAALVARSPAAARTASSSAQPGGVYSRAQATRGAALYADNCSYCHLVDLSGGDLAPALTGPSFTARWTGKPLNEVFDYTRTAMPLNSPGGLSLQQNADILAFLLQKAGFPAGPADLPARSQALGAVRLAGVP